MDRREFLVAAGTLSTIALPAFSSTFDLDKFLSKIDDGKQKEVKPQESHSADKNDAAALFADDDTPEKFIWLTRRDSGEEFKEVFYADGKFNYDAYKKFCWIMRDVRGGDLVVPIDANILNIAYKIQNTLISLDFRKPININSGYRSPKTNANTEGSAKNSYHMKGRAIDVSMQGMDATLVGYLGRIMAKGGVGFYPMHNFIHLDTGDKRQWIVGAKNDFKMLRM